MVITSLVLKVFTGFYSDSTEVINSYLYLLKKKTNIPKKFKTKEKSISPGQHSSDGLLSYRVLAFSSG